MQPEIILRDVRAAAAHFVNLLVPACVTVTPRPDCIAPGSDRIARIKEFPVRGHNVLQQRRRFAHVDDHDLFVAVVIEISDGEAARGMSRRQYPLPACDERSKYWPSPRFQ